MPLRVLIVGGGLIGCATAIGCARHGHQVTIYERRPSIGEDSGAGIALSNNSVIVLKEWGLFDDLCKVARENNFIELCEQDGTRIALADFTGRGTTYFALRRAYLQMLKEKAFQLGVKVVEGVKVEEINIEAPRLVLEDGSRVEGDLIIGADGSHSKVRQTLFPGWTPSTTNGLSIGAQLPLEMVEQDTVLRTLQSPEPKDKFTLRVGHNSYHLTFPTHKQACYDIVFVDLDHPLDQDPNPNYRTERIKDVSWINHRWQGFDEPVKKAFEVADTLFKWRFVEVDGLKSWSSPNGKVVLIGDACHSMTPNSGQGTAMGLEDAATLTELLRGASAGDDLRPFINVYEKLRIPRTYEVQKYARWAGKRFGFTDPKDIAWRNSLWKSFDSSGGNERLAEIKALYARTKPDKDAPWGTLPQILWLDHYDVFKELQAELAKAKL